MSPDQITELQLRHLQLTRKIENYFTAQANYFKNRENKNLIILKNYEKDIKEFLHPKQESQQKLFDWLGQ